MSISLTPLRTWRAYTEDGKAVLGIPVQDKHSKDWYIVSEDTPIFFPLSYKIIRSSLSIFTGHYDINNKPIFSSTEDSKGGDILMYSSFHPSDSDPCTGEVFYSWSINVGIIRYKNCEFIVDHERLGDLAIDIIVDHKFRNRFNGTYSWEVQSCEEELDDIKYQSAIKDKWEFMDSYESIEAKAGYMREYNLSFYVITNEYLNPNLIDRLDKEIVHYGYSFIPPWLFEEELGKDWKKNIISL